MSIVEVVRKTTTVVEVAHPGVQGPPGSGGGGGSGTVTSVSVVTANGVSGSVATATTTPAITLALGDITPTSVAASGTVTGSNLSGTNTGDQTITLSGEATGSGTGSFAVTLANSAVIGKLLTGLSTATNAVITAADSILTALGKLQKQVSDNLATLTSHTGAAAPHSGHAANGAVGGSGITMTTARLLGRNTASTGPIEEITLGTNLSFSGTTLNASGGSPGGSSGTLQYNNAGAFGGVTSSSVSGADITLGGRLTMSGSTATANTPLLDLQQTWNAGATAVTGIKVNITDTASAAGSLAQEWQVGGTQVAAIRKDGSYQMGGSASNRMFYSAAYGGGQPGIVFDTGGATQLVVQAKGLNLKAADDIFLTRSATGQAEFNNGTIGTTRDLKLRSLISSGGVITLSSYTVATLPTAASNAHAVVAVTDATAITYRGALTGGGSTKGIAYCDGSSWMGH